MRTLNQSLLEIQKSNIPNAGLGLFYIGKKPLSKNTRITWYSSDQIYKTYPNHLKDTTYLLNISKNQFMNSSSNKDAKGRMINASYKTGKRSNVRFSESYRIWKCRKKFRIPIFTTRVIKPGDELLLNYGDSYFI